MTKKFSQYRQWVISVSAVLTIIVGTVLLVAFAQGYTYDSTHRQFSKAGLVLIDSNPNGAIVSLGNKQTNKKTPYRYTSAPIGNLAIMLEKPEYRNWLINTIVKPGEVTFVDYAILLPIILQQQSVVQPQTYETVIQSGNHEKTIAFSRNPLTLYTLSSSGQAKVLYQPSSNVSPPEQIVDISQIQLSHDGNHVIFRQRRADNITQTIVIETNNLKIDNLTAEFGFTFDNLQFNQRDSSELFWLEAGVIKKIRLNNKSISANLISSVANLNVEKDRLLITHSAQSDPAIQQLSSYDLSGQDEKKILQLPFSQAGYQARYIPSRYAEYITILNRSTAQLQLIKNPYAQDNIQTTTTDLGSGVTDLVINPSNRFIAIRQNDQLRTLDLEFNTDSSVGTSLQGLAQWDWYDDYHMILRQNQQIRFIDYDGQNNQIITPVADVAGFSIQRNDRTILPLNSNGNLFRLFLTKR